MVRVRSFCKTSFLWPFGSRKPYSLELSWIVYSHVPNAWWTWTYYKHTCTCPILFHQNIVQLHSSLEWNSMDKDCLSEVARPATLFFAFLKCSGAVTWGDNRSNFAMDSLECGRVCLPSNGWKRRASHYKKISWTSFRQTKLIMSLVEVIICKWHSTVSILSPTQPDSWQLGRHAYTGIPCSFSQIKKTSQPFLPWSWKRNINLYMVKETSLEVLMFIHSMILGGWEKGTPMQTFCDGSQSIQRTFLWGDPSGRDTISHTDGCWERTDTWINIIDDTWSCYMRYITRKVPVFATSHDTHLVEVEAIWIPKSKKT